jgi:hypothetical protein
MSALLFSIFFERYVRPRYFFSLQFWFILFLALGLYGIWVSLKSLFAGAVARVLVAGILFILSFNGSQVFLPALYDEPGYMPITEEYHDNVDDVYHFLLGKTGDNDVLISTVFGRYVEFLGEIKFRAIYPYDRRYSDPHGYVVSIVEQYDSGWIVLDDRRYKLSVPLPLYTVSIKDKKIEYIGIFANQYVWRWGVE